MSDTLLDRALTLARKGFRVFPCGKRGKSPVFKNPFQRATTNETTINKWWGRRYKNCNIGLHLTGVLVVDIDGPEGQASYARLAQGRPFPATHSVSTSNGGKHLFYRLPDGLRAIPGALCRRKGQKQYAAYTKIDIKGTGGIIIGAGSVHKSGGIYAWDNEPAHVNDFAPAPQWMVHDLCEPERPEYLVELHAEESASDPDAELLAVLCERFAISPGTRNTTVAQAAAWMLGRGVTRARAKQVGASYLRMQGRDYDEAHAHLERTIDELFDKLASGDESVYLMDDHEKTACDYYQAHTRQGRTLNRFSVLPLCDVVLSDNEYCFLQAVDAFLLYEIEVVGKQVGAMPMTYNQLKAIYKLLHGRSLCIDTMYKMLGKFVSREGKPASKWEVMVQMVVGHIGVPSVYEVKRVSHVASAVVSEAPSHFVGGEVLEVVGDELPVESLPEVVVGSGAGVVLGVQAPRWGAQVGVATQPDAVGGVGEDHVCQGRVSADAGGQAGGIADDPAILKLMDILDDED
ncbi:Putative uncharacterized protein OS=Magnetospirillum magneticum (strain AMB-1 / ATCC 700264) GN=amb1929 PE=4 SV=1: Prim-Pol: Replicase [Gemmata massiliana]|uniref:DNA primase/polymerase bifunctional N-terminal domain-containing protein n=1 Tax=Gemmata massiliana TaxID=1210884 RepID=A0A6P2D153_9BACT|nr:bifunctional DNA primase/polymerase [Gemmata massiliana]VTR94316.1 Putative uncharacterized protein OS=Magnetospirillum magneticum (strain AMB-1 / ATCC 700264) GN=amb1929 PE=4 SV=1: Prim-Pol: Replicase [Gemmata massiliana]